MSPPRAQPWPAAMKFVTAACYLDTSPAIVAALVNSGALRCVQLTGPKGDRRIRKDTIDAYLLELEEAGVRGTLAA